MRRALSALKRPDVRKIAAAVRRADVRTALAAVRKPDMRHALTAVRNFYGASPLHLLALIGCFALAGYAAAQTLANPQWPVMLAWFAAAVIGHDLVVFPLYALADRSITGALRAVRPRGATTPPLVPAVNHVRVPALGTGLLFLVFFPGIIRQGSQTYQGATGRTQEPYLGRWLLLVAAMFAISAVIYAIRLGRVLHRDRRPSPRK